MGAKPMKSTVKKKPAKKAKKSLKNNKKVAPDKDGVFWRVNASTLEIDPALDAADEAFWKEQEGRMTKQIGQPCCTLSGMTHLLIEIPGDFAVVLHSELDCTNCFLNTRGMSGKNFYSVQVSQAQFTKGQMGPPLERCLELIIKHKKPKAIFVLGNCLVEMVYDSFDMVVEKVSKKSGTPIIPLRTSGLKHGSQAGMIDWLYSTFAELAKKRTAPKAGSQTKRMNLIGMPHLNNEHVKGELTGFLEGAGLNVNGVYPYETGFEDWMKVANAEANVVVDKSLYPKLLKTLEKMEISSIDVPLPVGYTSSRQFLDRIGERFGVEKAMQKAYEAPAEKARLRLVGFRKKFAGLRVAVGLRMVNNYRVDQLAYDGLGDLPTFIEAGFQIHLLIQGPGDDKSRKHFADRLHQLGCALPFEVFPDPFDLPPLLEKIRPDVAYLADHARWETQQTGIPLIQSRSLEPFFNGAIGNIDYFDKVLSEINRNGTRGAV
jgi:hypothetical protein